MSILGRPAVINHPPIDDSAPMLAKRAATARSSRMLLKAQLRHGQHCLSHDLAIALGGTLGMYPDQIRAADGYDPINTEGARA